MNKVEYLLAALKSGLFKKRAWVVSAFATISEGPDDYKKDPYPYRLVSTVTGMMFVDPLNNNELTRITDSKPLIPLYTFDDVVVVDASICKNVDGQIETTLGNLIYNLTCIVPAFKAKVPYQTGKISIPKFEDYVAPLLTSNVAPGEEENPKAIYCYEWEVYGKNISSYIDSLANLCIYAATEKVVCPPEGIEAFKKSLNAEYAGRLHDPIVLAEYEKKLKEFDDKYLAGDPSTRGFLSGKVRNIARKKMFLCLGAEAGFTQTQEVKPVLNSLDEGWSTKQDEFVQMLSASRYGSFSRGAETVKGGVSAKVIIRALNNVLIMDEDCGTKVGLPRVFTQSDIHQLAGREIKSGASWLLVTKETANKYIGVNLIVRSPQYCKMGNQRICKHCAGERLSISPTGVASAGTEISGIILTAFLKKMHGTVLSLAKMDWNKTIS